MLTELNRRHDALAGALEHITGMTGLKDAILMLPEPAISGDETIDNPDLRLFDIRSRQLEVSKNLLKSQRMPKAFGYIQGGYGNPPGNNFLSETADFYYSFGAGIKWNIFDWNKVKNEKKVIALQQGIIDNRKKDLEDNLGRQLESKKAEILSLSKLISTDSEIIALRKRITATAESQYANGTITATEYLNEMNAEHQAEINFEIHKISLAMAKTEYMNISGKEIE